MALEPIKQIVSLCIIVKCHPIKAKMPEIKKITCAAQLVSGNGHESSIEYSAQHTEYGQIWVEVSKL